MKKQILLKQFEYSILPFTLAITVLKGKHIVPEHLPLMKTIIDFENGTLSLEADWHFTTAYNKSNETGWGWQYGERVKIEATIFPALAMNLNDTETDDLICPLQGTINDGYFPGSCSGLMVIDKAPPGKGLTSKHWNINFYINDQFNDCEIRFKLPVYPTATDPELN